MTARLSLREQLDRARRNNYRDLRAPAFDGLHVRCRALTQAELQAALKRPDETEQSIDVLTTTCLGVWQEVDGKGVSPVDGFSGVVDLDTGTLSGELPTFRSQELADALDVGDLGKAGVGALVRALLAPNSDLPLGRISTELLEWSAGTNEQVMRDARPS